jgi:chloramphenicol 3-O phosphotransferase
MVILLNGVSSSGKTSIAGALQAAWHTPLLNNGVDTIVAMLPARFCGQGPESSSGLQFVQVQTQAGPVVQIRQGPYVKRLFAGMVGAVGALARAGNDLVVDEVLLGDELLRAYVRELRAQTVYFVAVHCPLAIVEQRARERGDRFVNSARAQFPVVHGPTRHYDLALDTASSSPEHLAGIIKDYVTNTSQPQGFAALERSFGGA